MRLVVDTNVFVSAALKQASWPGNVVRWLDLYGGLLKTDVTEGELVDRQSQKVGLICPAASAQSKALIIRRR